jgi:AbrB family looped-hinge helix DNA binding protein
VGQRILSRRGEWARGCQYRDFACGNISVAPVVVLEGVFARELPFAILEGMTLRIDKAGRVILPKPVRDRLGLREGSDLEIEEIPEGVTLKPTERRPSMVKKQGLWGHTGKLPLDSISFRRVETIAKPASEIGGFVKAYVGTNILVDACVEEHQHLSGVYQHSRFG